MIVQPDIYFGGDVVAMVVRIRIALCSKYKDVKKMENSTDLVSAAVSPRGRDGGKNVLCSTKGSKQ